MKKATPIVFLLLCLVLASCTYNPLRSNNHLTGSPVGTAVGAGVGAGTIALLGGSKTMIALGGIGGGALGYYFTTLRYHAGGIMRSGGQVYKVGSVVGIYIPSDQLFEPNTDDFLPGASEILDSAVAVLSRYPSNNIIVSGNTSGFYRARWELDISERRAQQVSAYFWHSGIDNNNIRKLNYVGYGDFFPISNHRYNEGLRQNSRIQIISYPTLRELRQTVCRDDNSCLEHLGDLGKDDSLRMRGAG